MKKFAFILLSIISAISSIEAAKKPVASFGIFAGFSGANLMSPQSPSQAFDYELIGTNYPFKTYMPIRLHDDDIADYQDSYPYELSPFDYRTSFMKDMIFNLAAGVTFDVPIKKSNWAFKMYASYQTMGLNIENEITEIEKVNENELKYVTIFRRDVKNRYLVVPTLLKYSWPNRTTFYAQLGPYTGFLTNSKVYGRTLKTYLSDEEPPTEYTLGADSAGNFHTNKIDFGIIAGGGMEFYWTSNSYITLELNAGFGLRKIDAAYKNEYEEYEHNRHYVVDYSSKNYYSLNSYARNFHVMFTVGFRYSIYK